MPPPSPDHFLTLPRGLRVRLAVHDGLEPLAAVVRDIGEDHLTLGVLDLPGDPSTLKGLHASIAAQLHGRLYELDAAILDVETTPPALIVTVPVEARRAQRRLARVFHRRTRGHRGAAATYPRRGALSNLLPEIAADRAVAVGKLERGHTRVADQDQLVVRLQRMEEILRADAF